MTRKKPPLSVPDDLLHAVSVLRDFVQDLPAATVLDYQTRSGNNLINCLDVLSRGERESQWRAHTLDSAINMLSVGMAVCRRDHELSYINQSGLTMLIEGGMLPPQPEAYRLKGKLATLITEAMSGGKVKNHLSNTLLIQVEPYGGDAEGKPVTGDRRERAILLIRRRGKHPLPNSEELKEIFGLTLAEAKLALILLSGDSVKKCAEHLCVSEATARTQIRGILGKTGAKRQSDLMSILLSVPATLRH